MLVPFTCAHCGKETMREARWLRRNARSGSSSYCNLTCAGMAQTQRASGNRCTICGRGGKIIRGFCSLHYARWKAHGDPNGRSEIKTLAFIRDVALPYKGDDCLHWPFATNSDGRGVLKFGGGIAIAARLVCEMAHGAPASSDLEAAHSCGNGHLGCVNPRHLRWATHKENMEDMVSHGRSCVGERSHSAKITEEQAREILALRGRLPQKLIADRYGISRSSVYYIQSGRRWTHVAERSANHA